MSSQGPYLWRPLPAESPLLVFYDMHCGVVNRLTFEEGDFVRESVATAVLRRTSWRVFYSVGDFVWAYALMPIDLDERTAGLLLWTKHHRDLHLRAQWRHLRQRRLSRRVHFDRVAFDQGRLQPVPGERGGPLLSAALWPLFHPTDRGIPAVGYDPVSASLDLRYYAGERTTFLLICGFWAEERRHTVLPALPYRCFQVRRLER